MDLFVDLLKVFGFYLAVGVIGGLIFAGISLFLISRV